MVGTDLRLQLLEPDRYPYLFKCLYGILMLLPQSSAFVSLRNRINAVNTSGYIPIAPKPYVQFLQEYNPLLERFTEVLQALGQSLEAAKTSSGKSCYSTSVQSR